MIYDSDCRDTHTHGTPTDGGWLVCLQKIMPIILLSAIFVGYIDRSQNREAHFRLQKQIDEIKAVQAVQSSKM